MEASSQFHDDHAGVRLHMSRSWYKEPLVANQELLLLANHHPLHPVKIQIGPNFHA
jgi:hypothetical protein